MIQAMKSWLLSSAIPLVLLMPAPMLADDIEIYINSDSSDTSDLPASKVMLVLDYRPNLGSSFCPSLDPDCKDSMDSGLDDSDPRISAHLSSSLSTGDAVTELDVIRAILEWLFVQLDGFEVGIMLPHASNNNCIGPSATECSNGGYMLSGFKLLDGADDATDATKNKRLILDKLEAVRSPRGGNETHTFQGKEIYFELYRYLAGKAVYNGHLGYRDYGSPDSKRSFNLPDAGNADAAGNSTVNVSWDTDDSG